jgi:hypothetical protein
MPDSRGETRRNVFLSAVLFLANSSMPVRIRNLSPVGALIDGNDLPHRDDVVRLRRGPHSAVARVVWRRDDACGLRFSTAVPVREWIAYANGHAGQQQVDELMASVRDGSGACHSPVEAARGLFDPDGTAAQLAQISASLEAVGEAFAALPAVIDEGADALQLLDMARQKLANLAETLRAGST